MSTIGTPTGKTASHTNAGPAEATCAQVQRWLSSGEAVLIDVREPDEHMRERIEGAVLMPLSTLSPAKAAALVKPGQRLVFHCRGGRRSADACLTAAGSGNVMPPLVSMTGGIEAWKKDNLPVVVNTEVSRISIMRQVQMIIGVSVLAGSALTYFVHPGFIVIPAFFGAGLSFAGASGFCALATVVGMLPWNKAAAGGSCNA